MLLQDTAALQDAMADIQDMVKIQTQLRCTYFTCCFQDTLKKYVHFPHMLFQDIAALQDAVADIQGMVKTQHMMKSALGIPTAVSRTR